MELRHLRYFQAVAETLSFSRAAERVHVAQPAISRQISDLEDELGVKLFVRSTVDVRLTDAGAYLLPQVNKLLAQLAIITTATQEIARGVSSVFNIGCDWTLPMHLVNEAVQTFHAEHRHVTVNFIDLRGHEQLPAIRDGRINVGIVPSYYVGRREDLEILHLAASEVRVAVPSAHACARRKHVRLRELKDETWLTLNEKVAPGVRAHIIRTCRLAGFKPRFGRTSASINASLAMVAADQGVCFVLSSAPMQHQNIRLLRTDCPAFDLYAVWLRENGSPLVAPFVRTLQQALAGNVGGGHPKQKNSPSTPGGA